MDFSADFEICPQDIVEQLDQGQLSKTAGKGAKSPSRVN
jgi:hypothetical protein